MHRLLRYSLLPLLLVALLSGCTSSDDGADGEDAYADSMAAQHQDDTTDPTAIVMEPRIPVAARPVSYGEVSGETLVGYIAQPTRPDSVAETFGRAAGDTLLPAVIVIHEWWGLNDNIRAMARRLAGEGYQALAVDLYRGDVAANPDQARNLMQQARGDDARLNANLEAAYQFLTEGGDRPVAVIGWCFGGGMALRAAVEMPGEIDAAVVYYGNVSEFGEDELEGLQMPVLGLFGGQDEGIPVDGVRAFEETMNELGKEIRIEVYEDAGHAFANPTGNNYVASAAEDAWEKTTAFLREHLWNGDTPAM